MNTNKWEITANRFVAYIDIIGFKNMVARQSHDDIYIMMKKIERAKIRIERIRWRTETNLVKSTNYSDSIMIY